MIQGVEKKTIGQNSPEALPEALKGVCKLVPNSNEKVALSKPQVLPCQRFYCSVHHLNNNMTHKTKVKSRETGKNRTQNWSVG